DDAAEEEPVARDAVAALECGARAAQLHRDRPLGHAVAACGLRGAEVDRRAELLRAGEHCRGERARAAEVRTLARVRSRRAARRRHRQAGAEDGYAKSCSATLAHDQRATTARRAAARSSS